MLLAELPTSIADAQKICLPILERMRSVRSCVRPTAVHFIRKRGVGSRVESAVVRQPFVIGGLSVKPGERRLVDLPISKLSNHAPVALPVPVDPGPQAAKPGGPAPTYEAMMRHNVAALVAGMSKN